MQEYTRPLLQTLWYLLPEALLFPLIIQKYQRLTQSNAGQTLSTDPRSELASESWTVWPSELAQWWMVLCLSISVSLSSSALKDTRLFTLKLQNTNYMVKEIMILSKEIMILSKEIVCICKEENNRTSKLSTQENL